MEPSLADEDFRIIEANALGRLLFVSRIKPLLIYLLLAILIAAFILCVILGYVIFENIHVFTRDPMNGVVTFLIPFVLSLVLAWAMIFNVSLARAQYLVVCEHGLFERKKIRRVEVVFWRNLRSIERGFSGYVFLLGGGIEFTLEYAYQRPGEIVRRIREAVETSKLRLR